MPKRARIRRLAARWLEEDAPMRPGEIRFDVAAILGRRPRDPRGRLLTARRRRCDPSHAWRSIWAGPRLTPGGAGEPATRAVLRPSEPVGRATYGRDGNADLGRHSKRPSAASRAARPWRFASGMARHRGRAGDAAGAGAGSWSPATPTTARAAVWPMPPSGAACALRTVDVADTAATLAPCEEVADAPAGREPPGRGAGGLLWLESPTNPLLAIADLAGPDRRGPWLGPHGGGRQHLRLAVAAVARWSSAPTSSCTAPPSSSRVTPTW